MIEWLPARIRIGWYHSTSAYAYMRARMYRNARNRAMYERFSKQAALDARIGREMLFELIDNRHPSSYQGELKGH